MDADKHTAIECSIADRFRQQVARYTVNLGIAPDDRLTLLQAPHFSGAVSSFFCAFLNGASCHPYDLRRMGFGPMPEWMRSHAITIFHSVPAIFREIFGRGPFPDLRCIRLEGDRASARDIELFKRPTVAHILDELRRRA